MARKDLELRPVMTRIPEGLRRRLEHEAKRRGRSMNAEIINRLQASFDIPDIAEDVVSQVESAIEDASGGLWESLNEIQSQNRAILSHLGLPDPAEEARARKAEARKPKATSAQLEEVVRAMERAGFKIAGRPETGPSAASETKDNGEKK